jgi:pyruvate dehydrogenase E1 component beta subunit
MRTDNSVVLLGEDIGRSGGSFGVTRGLQDEFGESRVRDTPISESTLVGMAVGASMTGLKPVVEIMFMDFLTFAMDALVNQAAKAHFMFGGQVSVPMVLRTPHGGGLSAGPQHSQCLEGWLAHVPGLKVVVPWSVSDAYHLMKAAIADPNPVIFVENKSLYGRKSTLDEADAQDIGTGKVLRDGSDITLLGWGAIMATVLEAAALLKEKGIASEVIDLRSLQPWDEALVLSSLKRTNNLVVVHEAVRDFGPGAEIVARMADLGFDFLDGPIKRVGAAFSPVPFSQEAERDYLPSVNDVVSAALNSLS